MSSFSHPLCFTKSVSKLRKIWWRVAETVDDWLCDHNFYWHWRLSNAYYYVISRLNQTHMIDTKLEKGHWIDKVSLMEAGLLELVDSFVSKDEEDAFSVVFWDDEFDGHYDAKCKMIEILYWKHVRKPALEAEKDALWDDYHKKYPTIFRELSEEACKEKNLPFDKGYSELVHEDDVDPVKREEDLKNIMDKETLIEKETQRILHLCVDVRNYLWT